MYIGAHISAAGSPVMALERALELGCTTFQMFASNPRTWNSAPHTAEVASEFQRRRQDSGMGPIFFHGIYLVNLGSDDPHISRNSFYALIDAVERCRQLGAEALVFHLGSAGERSRDAALERAVAALSDVLPEGGSPRVLLENTAGAGGTLGATFDELAWVVESLDGHPALGICLDTCHAHVSGWNLSGEPGVKALVAAIEDSVGLERLGLVHANDAFGESGSHRDRHENLGKGTIGLAGFRALLTSPGLRAAPWIIETPKQDPGADLSNLGLLRRLAGEEL